MDYAYEFLFAKVNALIDEAYADEIHILDHYDLLSTLLPVASVIVPFARR